MPSVFFTSDTHFGHKFVADHRGFQSVDEMNSELVRRWNAVVGRCDRVYHLGDFALGSADAAAEIANSLNGQIFLIRGNHEAIAEHAKVRPRFEWIKDYASVKIGDQKIYMLHYAMRVWNCSHHGSWHLYGHSHGNLPDLPNSKSFDVGVDCWGLSPISYEQVAEKMAQKIWEPVDHHGVTE